MARLQLGREKYKDLGVQGQRNRKIQIYRVREIEILVIQGVRNEGYRHIGGEKQKVMDIQEKRDRKIQTYKERERERHRHIGRQKWKDMDIQED